MKYKISTKIVLFILLICLQSCNSQNKKSSFTVNSLKKEIDLKKTKLESNINVLFYNKWKLKANDIEKILKLSQPISDEEFHDLYEVTPCVYKCKIIDNKKSYSLEINSGSFITITDDKTIKILGCKSDECKDFFIFPHQGAEINERIVNKIYMKILDSVNTSKSIKSKINNSWYGKYTFNNNNFEQGYREYTISIDEKKCFIYAGTLPACEIVCIPKKNGNQIDFFYDSQLTDRSTYSYELVQKSEHGDLIFSIYLKNNKKFVKSPLIKYWKDDLSDFKTNQEIELTNK